MRHRIPASCARLADSSGFNYAILRIVRLLPDLRILVTAMARSLPRS